MSRDEDLALQHQLAGICHGQDLLHIIAAESEFANFFPKDDIDTLIWLRTFSRNPRVTCADEPFPAEWLLPYRSADLRSCGLAKFSRLLDNARYQHKTTAELRANGHQIPPGIRYVLDLGPSKDCDLHLEQLEALTLPRGIIQYSMMTELPQEQRVPVCVAGGHDDACRCYVLMRQPLVEQKGALEWGERGRPFSAAQGDPSACGATATTPPTERAHITESSPDRDDKPRFGQGNRGEKPKPPNYCIWEQPLTPDFRRIGDYCEVRHASNVIRLLRGIQQCPLLLNSAARVYTMAGLVKLFGPPSQTAFVKELHWRIYDWFFTRHNTVIIDTLPEECFRIAWNIRLPAVVRVAYRILVAERALRDAADESVPRKYSRQKMPFGRELFGMDDDIETMLDHASEALISRMSGLYDQLLSDRCLDLFDMPERQRVLAIQAVLDSVTPQTTAFVKIAHKIDRILSLYGKIVRETFPIAKKLLAADVKDHLDPAELSTANFYTRPEDFRDSGAMFNKLQWKQKLVTAHYWRMFHKQARAQLYTVLRKRIGSSFDSIALDLRDAVRDDPSGTLSKRLATLGIQGATPLPGEKAAPVRIYRDFWPNCFAYFTRIFQPDFFQSETELLVENLSPHLLLSLTQNEFRFLPLWAGGEDDGTGAVFQEPLPMAAQTDPVGPALGCGNETDAEDPDRETAAKISTDASSEGLSSGYLLVQRFSKMHLPDSGGSPVASVSRLPSSTSQKSQTSHSLDASSYDMVDSDILSRRSGGDSRPDGLEDGEMLMMASMEDSAHMAAQGFSATARQDQFCIGDSDFLDDDEICDFEEDDDDDTLSDITIIAGNEDNVFLREDGTVTELADKSKEGRAILIGVA